MISCSTYTSAQSFEVKTKHSRVEINTYSFERALAFVRIHPWTKFCVINQSEHTAYFCYVIKLKSCFFFTYLNQYLTRGIQFSNGSLHGAKKKKKTKTFKT